MQPNQKSIFTGLTILSGQHWIKDQALIVEDGKIKAIIPKEMAHNHLPAQQFNFPDSYYLVPGFIDLHIHGANGYDVMDGTSESLIQISQALIKEGVTGFLATTLTATEEQLCKVLSTIAKTMAFENLSSSILGVHLEGPFIAKSKSGAQLSNAVTKPDAILLERYQTIANHAIKILTIAPELEGANVLIETAKNLEMIISIGHTEATFDETMKAIELGCSRATHLFNAMRGLHQRAPGAAGALLISNATIELIVDNVHLHPAIVKLAYLIKGKDRINLVTDAIRAKCLGNGEYDLGGQNVTVRGDVATLADGTLAGSTLRMPDAIKNMVTACNCPLSEAILMASLIPARMLNLDHCKGEIAIDRDADLVILNDELDVVLTMRDGHVFYKDHSIS